jgi:uncharacterized Zn finger protein
MDELISHREFGRTRWSGGWLDALAELPGTTPGRLIRGRAYAREGRVNDLHIEPGIISARIQGSRPRPYTAALTVPVLDAAAWDRLLAALAGQARHLGALLGGELPAGIGAEQVLLPGPGQLRTVCTCPDRDEQPCKHAAAACYQCAPLFDEDPFALLLLRGRSRLQVLAALREQRGPTRPAALQGRLARDAYHATPGPLPSPEPPPPRPCDSDRPMFAEPPAACGISAAELAELAAGATRLAWELLTACAGR